MIIIDGSEGEGGGQILRTALTLSLLTGQPFRVQNIRGKRKNPGLLRQHLTAVNASTVISGAKVRGAEINSRELVFEPKTVKGGEYEFSIGSAGSTTLVLQTILLPLLSASTPSSVVLNGGTHNPLAPPFDFIERTFLPLLRRLGASLTIKLERAGFYPAGGGRVKIEINPSIPLEKLNLLSPGNLKKRECRAVVAGLPGDIAKRELAKVKELLNWEDEELRIIQLPREFGPGNVMFAELRFDEVTHTFTSFGERGVSAENVAVDIADQVKNFLKRDAAVECYLADQLLLPCIWAKGGTFTTDALTSHFQTNLALIKKFIEVDCLVENLSAESVLIKIS